MYVYIYSFERCLTWPWLLLYVLDSADTNRNAMGNPFCKPLRWMLEHFVYCAAVGNGDVCQCEELIGDLRNPFVIRDQMAWIKSQEYSHEVYYRQKSWLLSNYCNWFRTSSRLCAAYKKYPSIDASKYILDSWILFYMALSWNSRKRVLTSNRLASRWFQPEAPPSLSKYRGGCVSRLEIQHIKRTCWFLEGNQWMLWALFFCHTPIAKEVSARLRWL